MTWKWLFKRCYELYLDCKLLPMSERYLPQPVTSEMVMHDCIGMIESFSDWLTLRHKLL